MRGFVFHTGHDLDRIDKTQRNQQSRQIGQHKNDRHRVDRLAGARAGRIDSRWSSGTMSSRLCRKTRSRRVSYGINLPQIEKRGWASSSASRSAEEWTVV
jgi:hypothetical protein